ELVVDPGFLDHLEVDPRLGTPVVQDRDIPLAIVSEREVWTLDHAARRELVADDPFEELLGRELQEPGAGPEDAHLGGAVLAEQLDLALRPDQRYGSLLRPEQRHRMRVEGDR